MLKVVVVEKKAIAKDIIFGIRDILNDEFTFTYYTKIVDFVHDHHLNEYDLIIMDEAYNNVRISSALNLKKNSAVLIYTGFDYNPSMVSIYAKMFFINKLDLEGELNRIKGALNVQLLKHNEYYFSYNGLVVKLKYRDIYYVEKDDKNMVYHTKKGEFYQRGSIAKLAEDFLPYDFVRINSGILVNYEYIFKIEDDEVELHNHVKLPISRSRRPKLLEYIRAKAENSK